MPSLRPILASPITAISAAAAFVASALFLPIDQYGPSVAGRALAEVRDVILGRAMSTNCMMRYAQTWYTLDARDQVVPASDELVRTAPNNVPLVLVSADTFPSGPHGLWAPTRETWDMRITVTSTGLSIHPKFAEVRARFVDDLVAAGDPTFSRDQVTLRTTDIRRHTILWAGYFHNTISLTSLLLFATSASFVAHRACRRFRTPPGHCPRCRYDLCGTPPGSPCPECGNEVSPDRRRT